MVLQMKKFDKYLSDSEDSEGPPCEEDEDEMEIATLPVQEQMFHYVSNGNITKLTYLLDQKDETGLDIDQTNPDGLSPLGIAIREGFLIVVYRLLDHGARIGDALLRAVDVDFQQGVTVLLEHAVEQSPEVRDSILKCQCETNDMHPDVTPIVRAAQKNNFTLVKVLYDIGLRIPEIKMSSFEYSADDSLQRSVGTLEIYRGLASPAYVCFSTKDPIGRAFKLCATLHKVGVMEVEFNHSYVELADSMEQFAADLVSYARNTEEIMTILTYNANGNDHNRSFGLLPTINRAIACEQKKFVAQPNCQQAVRAAFYQRLLWLNDKSAPMRLLIQFLIIFFYPVLSIVYKLGISEWCDDFVKIPAVRFLMQLGSDVTLLTIVLGEVLGGYGQSDDSLHDSIQPLYFFAFIYALGMVWREILYARKKGTANLKSALHMANMFIALLLFAVFFVHVISFFKHKSTAFQPPQGVPTVLTTPNPKSVTTPKNFVVNLDPSLNATVIQGFVENFFADVYRELDKLEVELDQWTKEQVDRIIVNWLKPTFEQQGAFVANFSKLQSDVDVLSREEILLFSWHRALLMSRALMALAAVISFTRIQPYLVTNDDVGPLQISLKSMLLTTSRFCIVVIAVLIAFACGLTFIYADTYKLAANKPECENAAGLKRGGSCSDENYFETIVQSMFSLYWSLFGLMPREAVQSNAIPRVLESAGTLLYASFYVFCVVVLLNALIAVMSNVYNAVEENSDREWKFNRTSLWMTFLDETFHVPPPFNLIPRMSNLGMFIRKKSSTFCPQTVITLPKCRCCNRGMKRKKSKIRVPLADEVELDGIITQAEITQNEQDHYKHVMSRIVDRYIADRTSHERNLEGDISIADLRNLKNDVVGLRYELFKKLWNVNEKLEQHSAESGEIRKEMVHVSGVFDTLAKNKNELDTYREESNRLQEMLKSGMEKLPDIPELPQEAVTLNKPLSRSNTTVNEIVDFFETLDEDFLNQSQRSLPLPDRSSVTGKRKRKSRLPRMIRTSPTSGNSKESLDSEGSMESKDSVQSEVTKPKQNIPLKGRRGPTLDHSNIVKESDMLSQSDGLKEIHKARMKARKSSIPKISLQANARADSQEGNKLTTKTKGSRSRPPRERRLSVQSDDSRESTNSQVSARKSGLAKPKASIQKGAIADSQDNTKLNAKSKRIRSTSPRERRLAKEKEKILETFEPTGATRVPSIRKKKKEDTSQAEESVTPQPKEPTEGAAVTEGATVTETLAESPETQKQEEVKEPSKTPTAQEENDKKLSKPAEKDKKLSKPAEKDKKPVQRTKEGTTKTAKKSDGKTNKQTKTKLTKQSSSVSTRK